MPGVAPGFGGQQVVLERPIVAAASDPDVAASQPLAQRGQHRRFVETPVRRAVREDQLAPLRRQERRRRTFGQDAGAVAIHRPEKLDGGEHRIVRRVRPEVERREKARAEPAQDRVSLGRRDEDVLIRHIGHGPDDGKHAIELLHADLAFDHGDAILSGFLRAAERGDGAAEQDQCPGDIAPRGLETPLVAVPRPAEQGAHVFLEHGERRVGEPGFEARSLDNEDRRPPRGFELGDVRDGHDRSFVDQPGEASGMNSSGARWVDSQPPRVFEAIQQRDDVGGRGRLRIIPQPGEAGSAQFRIDREQSRRACPAPTSDMPAARASKVFFRARARAANPIRSNTAAAGSKTPLVRRWASIAWTMGSPRSVAQAASVPTRRQVRQSAKPKRRSPRYLCSSTACSRRVWSRCA